MRRYRDRMPEVVYIGPGGRRRRSKPLMRTLIGDALRRHRHQQRRTLADVARNARVSVPYLSEIERGRKEASSEVLASVCEALGIELGDLLADVGHGLLLDRAPVVCLEAIRARRAQTQRAPNRGGDVVLLAA